MMQSNWEFFLLHSGHYFLKTKWFFKIDLDWQDWTRLTVRDGHNENESYSLKFEFNDYKLRHMKVEIFHAKSIGSSGKLPLPVKDYPMKRMTFHYAIDDVRPLYEPLYGLSPRILMRISFLEGLFFAWRRSLGWHVHDTVFCPQRSKEVLPQEEQYT